MSQPSSARASPLPVAQPRRSTRQPVPINHSASSAALNNAIAAGSRQTVPLHPNPAGGHPLQKARNFHPHPLSKRTDPLPPFHPIHTGQARATTYPSRLRLGLTSLLQPLGQNGQIAGGAGAAGSVVLGKRSRGQINYAEVASLTDPEESDDSTGATGATTARGRALAARRRQEQQAAGTPPPEKRGMPGGGKSFLGQAPPPNLIYVEPAKKTRHAYQAEESLATKAEDKALLVPIRIELDTETHRIRDCFVWNTREAFISPNDFAGIFCADIGLPELNPYREKIAQSIREQIDEQMGVAEIDVIAPELAAEHVDADLRVILNIDVQIGTLHLLDSIEWDLSSPLTPEHFAMQTCLDLGISGEATPIVAHAVHEELLRHKRDALESGLVGRPAPPPVVTEGGETAVPTPAPAPTINLNPMRGPRKMEGVWRDWNESATHWPRVEVLSADDILDREVDKERATKRARRDRVVAPTRTQTRSTRKL